MLAALGRQYWHLHHNNAPECSVYLLQNFLINTASCRFALPLYSPDSAPSTIWLFAKLKSLLKERFQTVDMIQEKGIWQVMVILKQNFADCLRSGIDARMCVKSKGEYFEWDLRPHCARWATFLKILHCWILSGHTSHVLQLFYNYFIQCMSTVMKFSMITNSLLHWKYF